MHISPKKFLQGLLYTTPLLLLALADCGGGGGGSAPAPVAVVAPAAPTNVAAADDPGCTAQVKITWTASAGATNYNVYRSATSGVAGTKVNPSTVTASPYVDATVTALNKYYYTVTAVNSGGSSPASIEASATPSAALPCTSLGGSIQKPLTLTPTVSTFAGTSGAPGSFDATGTAASFRNPTGVTTDGINLYVVDTGNNKIRKIVIATGLVSTWNSTIINPVGITTDGTNLYVTSASSATTGSANAISKINSSGAVTLLTTLSFVPAGITWDGANLYVVDTTVGSEGIIQISPTGTISSTTFATGFKGAQGITFTNGNFYITDASNNTIDLVTASGGVATVFAGSVTPGSVDATGTSASFFNPIGITTDGTNLYVADTVNNKIRQIAISSRAVTTVAGTGANGGTDGPGASATFSTPSGITTDGTSLYNIDTGKNTVRKIQ
jgi:hypothetical protein